MPETPYCLRPIEREERRRLAAPLHALAMNTLFARAVLEQDAPGQVLACPAESPSVVYVVHDYGMSLLFGGPGTTAKPEAYDRILEQIIARPRTAEEWLQVHPQEWASRLTRLATPSSHAAPSALEQHTRVNFRFSSAVYRERRASFAGRGHRIARVGRAAFAMPGSVVPRAFFRDPDHFLREGIGFAVLEGDEPLALAFSAFLTSSQLEIGIETKEGYRGRGLATLACAALIDDCLARGLEPVWACRLENTSSHRLAQALGFEPTLHLPYFRLRPAAAAQREPPQRTPLQNAE